MNKLSQALGFDFGASSGRAVVGTFDGDKIALNEIHRFSNDPVELPDDTKTSLHWDVLRLFYEIKQGMLKAVNSEFRDFSTIGIDTWGVDYGLLDKSGRLLSNPYHYRDMRTDAIKEKVFAKIPKETIYNKTGIQFLWINTIFQLAAELEFNPNAMKNAADMLMIPDLFNYFLTGKKFSEYSIASTSQLLNPNTGDWDKDLINGLDLPAHIFRDIILPGDTVGSLRQSICDELGIKSVNVVATASHDTGSAVAAVPVTDAKSGDFVYISSGTWSLMGVELEKPFINEASLTYNFTNEGGVNKTTRFLKNIMGLWIIQETRAQWEREGDKMTFAHIEKMTQECEGFKCYIDPDDMMFATPGNMPARVADYCKQTGQYVPQTKAEIARCIYESLAMKYRHTLDSMRTMFNKDYKAIHIIGGGVKDKLLCGFAASAAGKPVTAGPVEATALGNLAVQFINQGVISDLAHARKVIKNSFPLEHYEPVDAEKWNVEYNRFKSITSKKQ